MTAAADIQTPERPVRGGALDMLRFLAAAFIVIYHYGNEAPVPLDHLSPAFGLGWLATDFFLILSGFVLGRAYGVSLDEGRTSYPAFFARRLARVWPGHLAALVIMLAVVALATLAGAPPHTPERFHAVDFLDQAALIHAWGVTHQVSWNEPSWSLSALIVCYAAFPLVWWACQPLKGRVGALVVGLALLLAGAAFSLGALGLSLYDLPFHYGVIRALPLFGLGMMLARFASGRRWSAPVAWLTTTGAVAALAALQMLPRSEPTAFASIVAIALVVVSADGLHLRGGRLVRAGADLSFALFITHAVSGAVWFGAMMRADLMSSWIAFGLSFVFALSCAVAFHHLFDEPLQRRLKALMARRPAAMVASEAA